MPHRVAANKLVLSRRRPSSPALPASPHLATLDDADSASWAAHALLFDDAAPTGPPSFPPQAGSQQAAGLNTPTAAPLPDQTPVLTHTPLDSGTQASAAAHATGPSLAPTGLVPSSAVSPASDLSRACVATAPAGTLAQAGGQTGDDAQPVSLLKRGMRLLTGGGRKDTQTHASDPAHPPVLALPAGSEFKRLVMRMVGF
ncbi:MAG: hypothetical protein WDW36_000240 [Sanguina aurantia]